jgi:hypothetical protein
MKENTLIKLPEDLSICLERAKEITKEQDFNYTQFNNVFYQNELLKEKIMKKYNITELEYIQIRHCMSYLEYKNRYLSDSLKETQKFGDVYKSEIDKIYAYIMSRAGVNKDIINLRLKEYEAGFNNIDDFHRIILLIKLYLNEYIYNSELSNHIPVNDSPYYNMNLDKIIWALRDYVMTLKNEDIFDNIYLVEESYQKELKYLNKKYGKVE